MGLSWYFFLQVNEKLELSEYKMLGFVCLEIGSHYVAPAGLELTLWIRLASDSERSTCPCLFPSAGILRHILLCLAQRIFLKREEVSRLSSKNSKVYETLKKSFPWGDFRTVVKSEKAIQSFSATFSKVSLGTYSKEMLIFTYE